MTLTEFSNTAPSSTYVSFFYDNIGGVELDIQAINVSFIDCNNTDIFDTLENLTHFGFPYNDSQYIATISQSTQKSTYFHYTVENFIIPATGLGELVGSCNTTTLLPGPEPLGFANSDYNVQFTNALNNRTSGYIYEVDRNNTQTVPGNYDNIIDESAELANVTDSNYSSQGLINSRYAGAKSTLQDYGISPVFGPKLVRAEVYDLANRPLVTANESNSTIIDICSKSIADREFIDILFAPSELELVTTSSLGIIDTPDERFIATAITKSITSSSWGANDTTLEFRGYGPAQLMTGSYPNNELELEEGDIFTYLATTYAERVKVVSYKLIDNTSIATNLAPNITGSYDVVRNYYGNRDQLALLTNPTAITAGAVIEVRKLAGDTILRADTSKAEKLTDVKLYIESSKDILYVNDEGTVIWNIHTCGT